MANYNKSFNLRNGVQVDEDNLVVDTLGKVGIGTTVPTEFLDVRGNTIISGFSTASDVYSINTKVSGILTASTITDGKITINSGVITATSGVVTFYGDGRGLVNIPTSQWVDIDSGLGYTSIYAQGFVGVNTNDPRYVFQVAGTNNLSNFTKGVGINSSGDILATGIITATTVRAAIAATFLTGTIDNARLDSNINVSGIVTASGGFVGSLTGTASTAQSLTGSPNITVTNVTAGIITATRVNVTGNTTIGGFASIGSTLSVSEGVTASNINSGFSTVGVSTVHQTLHVGSSGTFFAVTSAGRIGIGSASPTSDVLIRKSGSTLVEVISETDEARISIGQSVGVGNSSAVLRFGNSQSTFELINRSIGGFNNYIHAGASGLGTGNFNWIYGQTNSELMTLTYNGRLGIGKTNPSHELHVVGTSTVTSSGWFGGNLTVAGTVNAGTINLPQIIDGANLNVSTGISTVRSIQVLDNLIVDDKIGIGTTNPQAGTDIDARDKLALFGSVGINTVLSSVDNSLVVGGTILGSKIGIGTTATKSYDLALYGNTSVFPSYQSDQGYFHINRMTFSLDEISILGVGSTAPGNQAVDFSRAGVGIPGNIARSMIVPKVTSSERAGIRTDSGAVIFNTTANEFQGAINVGVSTNWINLGIQTAIINTNQINVSGVSTLGVGVTIRSGIVTATGGFTSGIGTEVKITTVGNQLIFTVPGVGTTSLTLF